MKYLGIFLEWHVGFLFGIVFVKAQNRGAIDFFFVGDVSVLFICCMFFLAGVILDLMP